MASDPSRVLEVGNRMSRASKAVIRGDVDMAAQITRSATVRAPMTRRVVSAAWQRASGWCVDPGLHRPYAPPVRHDGSAGPPETRWLRDSLRATQDERALFAITAAAVTARPAQFGATWARGERRALNPLAFMATASALV